MEGRGEDGGEAVERAGAAAGAGSARRRRSQRDSHRAEGRGGGDDGGGGQALEGFPEAESGGRQDQVREGEAGGHSVIGGRRARQ